MKIPKGFSIIEGRGTCPILVPTYLLLATKTALEVNDMGERLYTNMHGPAVCIQIIINICSNMI